MLHELRLTNFRCFERLDFRPGADWTFVVGANALGKTTVLEAVCVLLRLQSQRTRSLPTLVRNGTDGFSVEGLWGGSRMQFVYGRERRKLVLEGQEQRKTTEYLARARVVYFGNADLDLIRGSAEQRRRFLDFLAAQVDPGYRGALRNYEKAVRSRNFLLKQGGSREAEIRALEIPLLRHGALVSRVRGQLVERLTPACREAQERIGGAGEELTLRYCPGAGEDFKEGLERARVEDFRLRQTTVGPHRDEVDLLLDGEAAAQYGSEGQQRTLALALRFGQGRVLGETQGAAPVWLLDDVFGELDRARRNRLMTLLPGEGQKIVATTTLDWLEDAMEGMHYELCPGGQLLAKAGGQPPN